MTGGRDGPARVDLFVELDEGAEMPLYRQLYEGIREAVLSGRLAPGTRIPSTRDLSEHLDVSRTTVLTAVNRLAAEGFLETKVGAGTRVHPDIRPEGAGLGDVPSEEEAGGSPGLSERGRRLARLDSPSPGRREEPTPFQPGIPAIDRFPGEEWSRVIGRIWREAGHRELTYGDPGGEPVLREAVAGHLRAARGLRCTAEQVLVTSGTQQGLDLAARLLVDPGEAAWMEEPGYAGGRSPLQSAGADVRPIPVDEDGLRVSEGRRRAPEAAVAYVTPSHQMPLGVRMSLPRRLEMLEWAAEQGAWILEDDYDSEYRFEGRPLLPLRGIDRTDRVLYFGSFSKTMFPGLRLGYIVLPEVLVEPFRRFRATVDQHPPTVPQLAAAEFIDAGGFARHLSRMRPLYRKRHDILRGELEAEFGDAVEVAGTATGLHLVVHLPNGVDDRDVCRRAGERGLDVYPLTSFHRDPERERPGLVLGFGAYNRRALEQGVQQLAETWRGVP